MGRRARVAQDHPFGSEHGDGRHVAVHDRVPALGAPTGIDCDRDQSAERVVERRRGGDAGAGALLAGEAVDGGVEVIASREHPIALGAQDLHLAGDPGVPLRLRPVEQPDGREERAARRVAEPGRARRTHRLALARGDPTRARERPRAGCGRGVHVVTLVPTVELACPARMRLDIGDDRGADRDVGHGASPWGPSGCHCGSRFSANARGPSS